MKSTAFAFVIMIGAAAGCATSGVPAAGAPPAAAGKAPSAPRFLAADLKRMSAAELDETLGAPALTRVEGAGEFRRYMLDECALLVILYPDEKGERRVARLDAGALVSGAGTPDLDACLAAG